MTRKTGPMPPDNPLRGLDNGIRSPHGSGMDMLADQRVTVRGWTKRLAWLDGRTGVAAPHVVYSEIHSATAKDQSK